MRKRRKKKGREEIRQAGSSSLNTKAREWLSGPKGEAEGTKIQGLLREVAESESEAAVCGERGTWK
jgi:hypothetical protein